MYWARLHLSAVVVDLDGGFGWWIWIVDLDVVLDGGLAKLVRHTLQGSPQAGDTARHRRANHPTPRHPTPPHTHRSHTACCPPAATTHLHGSHSGTVL